MISVRIKVLGAASALQTIGRFADREVEAVEDGVSAASLVVAGQAKAYSPVDRGTLRASILCSPPVRLPGAVRVSIGSSQVYSSVMEDGRRAGARMPPIKALMGWVRRKRLRWVVTSKAGKQRRMMVKAMAFVIARSIARNGMAGRKFLATGLRDTRTQLGPVFQEAYDATLRRIVNEVQRGA